MTKILALDTATDVCSVALLYSDDDNSNDDILDYYNTVPRQKQTVFILSMLEELLVEAGLTLHQLDAIAFGCGPGSFTGVRLATSIAQSIAIAIDLPLIPISTLRTLAQGAYFKLNVDSALAVLNSRTDEVYYGIYVTCRDKIMLELKEERTCSPYDIDLNGFLPSVGIGNGWDTHHTIFTKKLGYLPNGWISSCFPSAHDMTFLAQHDYKLNKVMSPDQIAPVYLRDMIIE